MDAVMRCRHARVGGRKAGESHERKKLSDDQVKELVAMKKLGLPNKSIADHFGGLSKRYIQRVFTGKRRAYVWELERVEVKT